jgi:acetyltransferase-like isoleucine patch superfamily enzyme
MNITTLKNFVKCWPMPRFAACGPRAHFARPRYVAHPRRIRVGREAYIGKGTSLCVVPATDGSLGEIEIGNRVWITGHLTVYAEKKVVIEDNVLIAGGVFISDASRGHSTAELPYRDQPNEEAASVVIGEGSWLGQNCVIMPGVVIGRRCIVGSNSVVTTSLPPGSVAVGAPARIVKQWDWDAKLWRKTTRTGQAAEDRRAPDETPGGPAATGNIMPIGMRFAG